MNIYSVYTDSSKKKSNPILIKQGFSLIAGFLNFAWAFYHRMWFIAFLTLGINFLISVLNISSIAYSMNIAILFLFGSFASELREYYAKKNGLKLSDILLAHDEEEAEVKYYARTNYIENT
jgi:signal transduction histidine kinase